MNFDDFEKDLDKALVNQAVSKQDLEEMTNLFKDLTEIFNKSTSNPFYKSYLTIFSQVAKLAPNLSLNDFRWWKIQFILNSIQCLEKINRSDDTPKLHELIEDFFTVYKKILYKKTSFTFFEELRLKISLKLGREGDETVFEGIRKR